MIHPSVIISPYLLERLNMRNTPDRLDIAQALRNYRTENNYNTWLATCYSVALLVTDDDKTREAFLSVCGIDPQ